MIFYSLIGVLQQKRNSQVVVVSLTFAFKIVNRGKWLRRLEQKKRIRVTRKPKSCPNPLFEKWLIELKEDAVRKESKLQYVYGKVKLTPKFYFAVFPTMKHFHFCYL
jgi:hypothetical protein